MIRKKDVINKLKMWLMDLESEPDAGDYKEVCENLGAREAIECCIAEVESIPSVWRDASKELPTCNLSCLIAYQEIDIRTGEYSKTVHFLLCDYLPEYKHWNIKEPINVLKWMYLPDYEEVMKCL